MKLLKSPLAPLLATVTNIITALAFYMLARIIFVAANWQFFSSTLTADKALEMARGGLMFDTSAVMYTLALYIVLILLPLHLKETPRYHRACRWLWLVVNAVALVLNLMDCVYFRYTSRRTTATVFSEFSAEGNLWRIIGTELLHNWYLVLLAAALVWLMWKLYVEPRTSRDSLSLKRYYIIMPLSLFAMVPAVIGGIRGGLAHSVRPITISNANQYVDRPIDAAAVLNTPFSLLRTIGKAVFNNPHYFPDADLDAIYTPVHRPLASVDTTAMRRKNVVVIIIESFGKEYVGSLNRDLDGGKYRGFTPFTDSLLSRSLSFRYSFANGRKSIDAMPSILSGIPMMVEPFFLTPASMNDIGGLAAALDAEGYNSAFFHGAPNGSMGFQAFARATGFDAYYGMTEYCADPAFGGKSDFDGMWAIWDEPFLQFMQKKVSTMRQPFLATVFTASSHHPFRVPDAYAGVFKDDGIQPIHKCVRYTDMALQRFFDASSRQPWFNNTLFVIVADHTNQATHPDYLTDLGVYSIPIIFYTPDGSLTPQLRDDVIAQQASIMPTILGILGYNKPYLAFGSDLLNTPPADTWAFSYNNGVYQLVKGDLLLQFDGKSTVGLYRFKSDSLLRHNLANTGLPEQPALERLLRAIIQQYMDRMTSNRLLPDR